MKITLSADKLLIEKAHRYAKGQNTTLNNLIREYLRKITSGGVVDEMASKFESNALEYGGKSPRQYRFNRDEIYQRN
jgi:hypothetical protein